MIVPSALVRTADALKLSFGGGGPQLMVIGPVAHAMLIRLRGASAAPLAEVIGECRRQVAQALAHWHVSFPDIVAMLRASGLALREIATVSLAITATPWRPRLGEVRLVPLPEPDRAPVVRAGELDVEFVIDEPPHLCRVSHDAERLSDEYVRRLVAGCAAVLRDAAA